MRVCGRSPGQPSMSSEVATPAHQSSGRDREAITGPRVPLGQAVGTGDLPVTVMGCGRHMQHPCLGLLIRGGCNTAPPLPWASTPATTPFPLPCSALLGLLGGGEWGFVPFAPKAVPKECSWH